jgi:hypothetical protein
MSPPGSQAKKKIFFKNRYHNQKTNRILSRPPILKGADKFRTKVMIF